MVEITNALPIFGWMSEEELTWLAEHARTCSTIVEVGSYHGRSTVAMAANSAAQIWAVDTWNGPVTAGSQIQVDDAAFRAFSDNTRPYPNTHAIRDTSLTAAAGFTQLADMIFLDASHAYEDVAADIEAWRSKVRPGGILCGHDYGTWPGVKQAVDERFTSINLTGSIWSVVL